ncbi:hypothetical protein GALL_54690 [mine drainage metagenome]|uniref:DUF4397 domain-containing protein n=1 Tax=mine drainage metagenome TaxID=410659 RepID=A0A1J5T9X0_9ZZZZ
MKKIIFYIFFAAALVGIYSSCSKSNDYIAPYTTVDPNSITTSYLKFVHASPNFATIFGVPDAFNVIVNGTKINSPFLSFAGTSLAPVLTTAYGYVSVPSGALQIKLSTNGTTTGDSLAFKIYSKTVNPGQFYTFLLTDSALTGNPKKEMFIRDSTPVAYPGYYNLRFINAVGNDSATISTGTTTVDIFSYARNATLWTKIGVDSVTTFQLLGTNNFVADTLYVTRTPASGSPILSGRVVLAKLAISPLSRNYTIYYKGDGTQTTGTKARALAYYVNQ